MNTLGLRHVALNVKDPQAAKRFYVEVLKMKVEWEPDPENVYLCTLGSDGRTQDNLALHKGPPSQGQAQALDHIGFILPTPNDVDAWHKHVMQVGASLGAKIVRDIKTHRDGARSFYFSDPDGIVIQMIYHPPISGG